MVCLQNSGPRDALNFGISSSLVVGPMRFTLLPAFGDASPSKRIPKSVASSWTF
jgi:hypothetical protein